MKEFPTNVRVGEWTLAVPDSTPPDPLASATTVNTPGVILLLSEWFGAVASMLLGSVELPLLLSLVREPLNWLKSLHNGKHLSAMERMVLPISEFRYP